MLIQYVRAIGSFTSLLGRQSGNQKSLIRFLSKLGSREKAATEGYGQKDHGSIKTYGHLLDSQSMCQASRLGLKTALVQEISHKEGWVHKQPLLQFFFFKAVHLDFQNAWNLYLLKTSIIAPGGRVSSPGNGLIVSLQHVAEVTAPRALTNGVSQLW